MNQNKEDAKTKATKAIDDYYQKMIDIGNKHPEAQSQIITIVNKTTAFFMGILRSIQDFIVKLVDNIIKWVKEVFNKITEHFSVIAKAAISFFSGVLV